MINQYSLNLDNISRELHLVLEIIKSENVNLLQGDNLNDINWTEFIRLVGHHRLYSFIFYKIKDTKELFPSVVLQILSKQYKTNTFQMLQLCGEMEYLSRLLTQKNIRLLFLKGPVLADNLYGDISLRTSCDLDVLVPINDLTKIDEILLALGYKKDDYIKTVLGDWKWRHHHITYFNYEKGIKLEIHWRLNPGPGKEPSFNELWERKRKSPIIKTPIYYLGKEDLFLFLITHGARHGWSRLRWLLDIHQLLKQDLHTKKLFSLLRKYRFHHIGGQAVMLSSHLFNSSISEDMSTLTTGSRERKLAKNTVFYLERMVNLHSEPLPEEVSRYHKRYLFSLMSSNQKILFILSFLFPYPEDVETLPLPKKLHFLYFPLRPILWAWRKRKHALS